jgi:hypothetical protein
LETRDNLSVSDGQTDAAVGITCTVAGSMVLAVFIVT